MKQVFGIKSKTLNNKSHGFNNPSTPRISRKLNREQSTVYFINTNNRFEQHKRVEG